MMDYLDVLEKTTLFEGIARGEISGILARAGARRAEYAKGREVIRQGESDLDIGIVLSGRAHSLIESAEGKSIIIAVQEEGSYIGLLLAAARGRKSPVSVRAAERLEVLFVRFDALAAQHNDRLLMNCFNGISRKAMELYDRIDCLIRPGVRGKLLAYLRRLAEEQGGSVVTSPLDRGGMAEYINADRSAVSRELSRMKRDGLIDYYKNSFKLLGTP